MKLSKVELSWELTESGAQSVKQDGMKHQSLHCVKS